MHACAGISGRTRGATNACYCGGGSWQGIEEPLAARMPRPAAAKETGFTREAFVGRREALQLAVRAWYGHRSHDMSSTQPETRICANDWVGPDGAGLGRIGPGLGLPTGPGPAPKPP